MHPYAPLIFLCFANLVAIMSAAKGITLYTHKMCPFAQKAWIALNLAGSPFDLQEVQLYGGKPDWFLKMNPKGLVPVLKHGDRVIIESEVILDYIASGDFPTSRELGPEGEEERWWRQTVDLRLRPLGKSAVQMGQFSGDLKALLLEMEQRLQTSGSYLAGEDVSLADASAFPFLYRLDHEYKLGESDFPALKGWLQRMSQMDEVAHTVMQSWWWWW
jgi:glutathione S-transferase